MSEKEGNSTLSEKPKKSTTTATKRSTKLLNAIRPSSAKNHGVSKPDSEKRQDKGVEKTKKTMTDSLKKKSKEPLSVETRSKSETTQRAPSSAFHTYSRTPLVDRARTPLKKRTATTPAPKATPTDRRVNKDSLGVTPRTSTDNNASEESYGVTPRAQSDLTMQRRPKHSELSPPDKSLSRKSMSRCSTPVVPKPSSVSRTFSRNSNISLGSKKREMTPSLREKLCLGSPRAQTTTPRKEPKNLAKSGSCTARPRSPKDTTTTGKPTKKLFMPPRQTSVKRESVSPRSVIHSSSSHTGSNRIGNRKSSKSSSNKSSPTIEEKDRKMSVESTLPTEDGKSSDIEAVWTIDALEDTQSCTGGTLGRTVSRNSTPSPILMDRPSLTQSSNKHQEEEGQVLDMTEERERVLIEKQRLPSPELDQTHFISNNDIDEAPVAEEIGESNHTNSTNEESNVEREQVIAEHFHSEAQHHPESAIEHNSTEEKQEEEEKEKEEKEKEEKEEEEKQEDQEAEKKDEKEEEKDLVLKVERKTVVGSGEEEQEDDLELPNSPFANHIFYDILVNVANDTEQADIKPDSLTELNNTPASPKAKGSESAIMEPIVSKDETSVEVENKEVSELKVETVEETELPPGEAYLTASVLKLQETAYSPKEAISPQWLMDQASDTFYTRSWSCVDKVSDPCFEKEDAVPLPEQDKSRVSIEDFIKTESYTKKNKDIVGINDPDTFQPIKESSVLTSKHKVYTPRVEDPDDDDFEIIHKKKRNLVSRCAICIFGGLALSFFFWRK
eukprot:g8992.t1